MGKKNAETTSWIAPNPNAIATPFGIANMFSDGRVGLELLKLGLVPVCQYLKKDGGVVNVTYGPMIDHRSKQAIPVGQTFAAREFYGRFGLRLNETQCDTWASESHLLNVVILRRPEKNHLYVPPESANAHHLLLDPCDPVYCDMLAELDRIRSQKKGWDLLRMALVAIPSSPVPMRRMQPQLLVAILVGLSNHNRPVAKRMLSCPMPVDETE